MASTNGLAVAQWASALLSLFAILIASIAIGLERRRSGKQLVREKQREIEAISAADAAREHRRELLAAAINSAISDALKIMTENLPPLGEMYASWAADRGKPRELQAVNLALEALSSSAANSDNLALLLRTTEARAIIESTIHPPNWSIAPSVSSLLGMLARQAAALKVVQSAVVESDRAGDDAVMALPSLP